MILAKDLGGRGSCAMVGTGSGNWDRWRGRKATVEDCRILTMKKFRTSIRPGIAGTVNWNAGTEYESSIGFRIAAGNPLILTLNYCLQDRENIVIPIRLQTSSTQFSGRRWWFTCPLSVGGIACRRRVGNLYLAPGAKYFGCRHCHKLAYRSSQEAHQTERVFQRIGTELGYDREFAGRIGRALAARYK